MGLARARSLAMRSRTFRFPIIVSGKAEEKGFSALTERMGHQLHGVSSELR